jgi:hypothetical protein
VEGEFSLGVTGARINKTDTKAAELATGSHAKGVQGGLDC